MTGSTIDDKRCPECGGPLLKSHGAWRCPSRTHEPYAEELKEPEDEYDEYDVEPDRDNT